MGKQAKPTAVRAGETVKAGKKKPFQAPQPVNRAKQEARELGEKQFITKEQLSVPGTKIVVDKLTGKISTKVIAIPVPFLWDEHRKHFIFSPSDENQQWLKDMGFSDE